MRGFLILVLLSVLPIGSADACSCGPVSLSDLYVGADLIFVGRLVSVAISDERQWQLEGRFEDVEWFKGTPSESVKVTTHILDSMCGVAMLVAHTYLVFAPAGGELEACSTSGLIDGSWGDTPRQEWVEALRAGRITDNDS